MAAGVAGMKLLTRDAFVHLARLGDRVRAGMEEAFKIAGAPGKTYGYGSMVGYVFSDETMRNHRDIHRSGQHSSPIGEILFRNFLNNGVLPLGRGGFLLSTVMTEQDIDRMLEVALGGLRIARRQVGEQAS